MPYPFKYLAGVGVALKLVLALGGPDRENALFARYCTLAAIGTVADVMRMEGENRTIVSCGLAALPHTDFVGIHALLKEAGLLGKPITSIQIGFVLSPRINAAGRMGAADLAADLLQETRPRQGGGAGPAAVRPEPGAAGGGAGHLRRCRRPRSKSCGRRSATRWSSPARTGTRAWWASWPPASVKNTPAPSFMIHLKDGSGKGSCRSYGGFNLFAALESCSDLLDGFGGHELAAGFTIPEGNIDAFRQRMNRCVKAASGGEKPVSCLEVDAAISNPADMTLEQVDQPGPAGALRRRQSPAGVRPAGRHGGQRPARGTGQASEAAAAARAPAGLTPFSSPCRRPRAHLEPGCRVDAAFYLQANTFRGNTTLQLQLVDLRPSLTPSRHEAESLALLRRLVEGEPLTRRRKPPG